jgi:hypothetical protein
LCAFEGRGLGSTDNPLEPGAGRLAGPSAVLQSHTRDSVGAAADAPESVSPLNISNIAHVHNRVDPQLHNGACTDTSSYENRTGGRSTGDRSHGSMSNLLAPRVLRTHTRDL